VKFFSSALVSFSLTRMIFGDTEEIKLFFLKNDGFISLERRL